MIRAQSAEQIHARIDPLIRETWRLLVSMLNADEGSLWVSDEKNLGLRIVLNSGDRFAKVELSTCTSAAHAQVMKCFNTGQPIEDVTPFGGVPRDTSVDAGLEQQTFYQISVAFYLEGERIGVVTIIQLNRERPLDQWGFSPDTTEKLKVISRLMERLLRSSA